MDSIVGQAARTRYRMSSTRNMPITIRAPFGGRSSSSRITLR